MKQYLQSGVVIFAGILGVAAGSASADREPAPTERKSDLREAILRRFLRESRLPIETYAETFIQEADAHQLDWRLLPSLAIVESGGGIKSRANNLFGWNNGDHRFSSVAEAIHHVAEALAGARPYKGKDLFGKLAAYNRTPGYRALVMAVMRQIAPSAVPEFGL
jgi:hypothetical protein